MSKRLFRTVGIAVLAAIAPVAPAKSSKPKRQPEERQFQIKLSKSEQIQHALDRLTFGPRPGDFEKLRRMGVKKWVDQQLHPERIAENPALETKLAPLASLRMTQEEAVRHYPPPQLIAAVATGRQPPPDDPVARLAVERLVRKYRARKGATGNAAQTTDDLDPVKRLDEVLTAEQLQILARGAPDQKRALLASLPDSTLDDVLAALPRARRQELFNFAPVDTRRKILLMNAPQAVINYDLSDAKLYRAIYSNRQLEELLVDFWYNHFNVFLDKGADRFLTPSYERDAIRPYVLGRFRNMLEATAKSPAMLFYLDNWQSVGANAAVNARRASRGRRGLNENYARELMELHTLGVDGGYTQKDVTEVARCFTGWTIKAPRQGGGFEYNDRMHDKGEKIVLGVRIPAGGGIEDGEKVLDILAHHPSTARFISKELAQRFVADNPPATLIDRMAQRFIATDGDLREVMRAMLTSREFWSRGAYHAKVKTPFEMVVSAIRALNADVDEAFPLAQRIAQLGEPLYRKLEPTGYKSNNAEWVNSAALLARMNFGLALAQNRIVGVRVDASRLNGDPAQIAREILFRDVSPQTITALEKALEQQQAKQKQPLSPALVAGLVIGSPDFQRR
jgi:uncharacterized protein (DUF1800 family)